MATTHPTRAEALASGEGAFAATSLELLALHSLAPGSATKRTLAALGFAGPVSDTEARGRITQSAIATLMLRGAARVTDDAAIELDRAFSRYLDDASRATFWMTTDTSAGETAPTVALLSDTGRSYLLTSGPFESWNIGPVATSGALFETLRALWGAQLHTLAPQQALIVTVSTLTRRERILVQRGAGDTWAVTVLDPDADVTLTEDDLDECAHDEALDVLEEVVDEFLEPELPGNPSPGAHPESGAPGAGRDAPRASTPTIPSREG